MFAVQLQKLLKAGFFLLFLATITDMPLHGQQPSPRKQMENCSKMKSLREKYKSVIQSPYVLEGCASRPVLCGEPGQQAIIPLSVLGKQHYRLYFDSEGFEGKVFVRVLTLNKKLIFSNENDPASTMFAFTATRTEKYFVEFNYVQSTNPDAVGCVSTVLATREF